MHAHMYMYVHRYTVPYILGVYVYTTPYIWGCIYTLKHLYKSMLEREHTPPHVHIGTSHTHTHTSTTQPTYL